jgi:hypothetical protein
LSSLEKKAMDFWFEFDKFFLYPRSDISKAESDLQNLDLPESFISSHQSGTLYTEFKAELNKPENQYIRDSIRLISDNHLRILNKFFGNSVTLEQAAFEYFGQGSLFDGGVDQNGQPRRRLDNRIHMMDGSIGGYLMWHSFIRSVMILGFSGDSNRWLQLDRHIALAAEIDSTVHPIQSEDPLGEDPRIKDPNANRIEPADLSRIRAFWLTKNVDEIDRELIQLGIE